MLRKRWRTWSLWGVGGVVLIGLGFALDAGLPSQPRFVLRGSYAMGRLSPDGKILTTGTLQRNEDGEDVCVSLKAWDTFTGQECGEYFRGLTLSLDNPAGIRWFQSDPGFAMEDLVYSSDRRYCALLHANGLAIADLQSGRGWPNAVVTEKAGRGAKKDGVEAVPVCRYLCGRIDTGPLHEKVPFKTALEYFADRSGGKLTFRVDSKAFTEELGDDAVDVCEEEVALPPIQKMVAHVALRLILAQVGKGDAACVLRHDSIEITTMKRARREKIWPPVFSPGGSFVAFMEGGPQQNKLHVVECATGQLMASLSAEAGAREPWYGFTTDEQMLFFDANKVFNTKTKQIQTFTDIPVTLQLAPDGKTMLANLDAFGVDLLDLRTGQKRRLAGKMLGGGQFTFAPDSTSLVRHTAGQLELWDLPTQTKRITIELGEREGLWPDLFISADSRVLCAVVDSPKTFTAWSIMTGERLWPPAPPAAHVPPPGDKLVILEGGGLMAAWEFYPRFTPDHRFLVERTNDRIDILNPASGEPHASLTLGPDTTAELVGFSADGRTMLTRWWDQKERKPWFAQEWFGKWRPWPKITSSFAVADVASARIQLRVDVPEDERMTTSILADDGRTLLTAHPGDEPLVITCWDVPGRPSPFLVVGIPLAMGCFAVLIRWRMRKKAARADSAGIISVRWPTAGGITGAPERIPPQ